MELAVKNITKTIKGKTILSGITMTLHSGKVYGFVGRNGSGKTMLFRAISGLMRIDSGEICLDGRVLHRDMDILPHMGIVLENAGLYPEYTGVRNLQILGKLTGVSLEAIREAVMRVGLDPDDRRTYQKYSLGMKQRIIIAQAIMEKPDVLLLDEPTNALDEGGVERIRKVVAEEKERGALVLLASHNKEDIGLLADEIFLMENGVLRKGDDGK